MDAWLVGIKQETACVARRLRGTFLFLHSIASFDVVRRTIVEGRTKTRRRTPRLVVKPQAVGDHVHQNRWALQVEGGETLVRLQAQIASWNGGGRIQREHHHQDIICYPVSTDGTTTQCRAHTGTQA